MSTDDYPMPYSAIFVATPGYDNLMDNYHQVGEGVWSIQISWFHPTKKLQITHSTMRSAATRKIITDLLPGEPRSYVISGFGVQPEERRYISAQVLGGVSADEITNKLRATAIFVPIPLK